MKMNKEFFVAGKDGKPTKKKCGGKKCEKPECNQPDSDTSTNVFINGTAAGSHPSHDRELRAKCLELALMTSCVEEDAVKWAKRYWEFVARGN